MTQRKIDLKKGQKDLYNPSKKDFSLIEVPEMAFLMIDGKGDPNAGPFSQAVEALYAVSFTVKFMSKSDPGIDYVVMPLEGLWWAEDMAVFNPDTTDRNQWLWTAMIRQPDHITAGMIEEAIELTRTKKKALDWLDKVRFESFHEGLSVQIMHIGPFSEEGPTIHRLHHDFIPANSLVENGKHHEIYLSDIRRSAPEKLKTVLRQPVRQT
jgi:hypothetical protein